MSYLEKLEVVAGGEYNETTLPGKYSEAEVRKAFDRIHDDAEHDSGHDGYTGTWAEVPGVSFPGKSFESRKEASEWLTNNAQKWEDALAVKFKSKKFKDDNAKKEFETKFEEMIGKKREIKKLKNDIDKHEPKFDANLKKLADAKNALHGKLTKGKFVSCPNCQSKINSKFAEQDTLHGAENVDRSYHKDYKYGWEADHLKKSGMTTCPACNKPLAPKSAQDKIGSAVAKLDEHRKLLQKLRTDYEAEKKKFRNEALKKYVIEEDTWLLGAWASS